jgi:hypothetical protein
MTKYIALATGAAIAIAATFAYAQTTPQSTDRPSGQPGEATSAKPDPDKKGSGKAGTGTPKAGGTQAPPSTDRPAGAEDATSAKPNPDKKQKQ